MRLAPLPGVLALVMCVACAPSGGEGEGEGEGEGPVCSLEVDADLQATVSTFCGLGGDCQGAAQIDPVPGASADSVAVCESDLATLHAVWRVNSEPGCHAVADAHEAFMACANAAGCDAFAAALQTCKAELETYETSRSAQEGACDE